MANLSPEHINGIYILGAAVIGGIFVLLAAKSASNGRNGKNPTKGEIRSRPNHSKTSSSQLSTEDAKAVHITHRDSLFLAFIGGLFILSAIIFGIKAWIPNGENETTEIEIFKMIESSKTALEEIVFDCNILEAKKESGVISNEEVIRLVELQKRRAAGIESHLNAYEFACAKFLDHKIDKARFKKTYQSALRQIMRTPLFLEHINQYDNYSAIKRVYAEWEK
jgi:hypothetical protein